MSEHTTPICKWLYPAAWLYGAIVSVRNKFFDWGFLPSKSFDIPVICIGNLAVGGTGKTPHTELLVRLLCPKYHVAVLSRGYKRRTKGYVLADEHCTAQSIGDEPYQLYTKFPSITLAVDEDRCHGIRKLMEQNKPRIDVILLDDAFQHRYVKPGLSILLTDYQRLFCDDALLPAGQLREPLKGKFRAQMVIVTKCPPEIKPIDFNIVTKRLQLYPYQRLYFSALRYADAQPLFPQLCATGNLPLEALAETQVLLLTGIASPTPLQKEVERYAAGVSLLSFADHHAFGTRDLQLLKAQFDKLGHGPKLILTTEKDATRLVTHPALDDTLKPYLYALPIEIEILQNQQDTFTQHINDYVRKNRRNSSFPQSKNAQQP